MANLPEKNVVLVDKITNVPTDSNLFINANGEFKQASVNNVVNSSTVVSTAVETAINTAVQDSIDSNFKQTSGSPILLTDSADGTLIDFKGKGRSTQNGTPTPDSLIAIKSVADSGYFDGELLQGVYSIHDGAFTSVAHGICNKNPIPCKEGDKIVFAYGEKVADIRICYYNNGEFLSYTHSLNVSEITDTAPANATEFNIGVADSTNAITPTNAKPITVTINGKYALIVKSVGKNQFKVTATSTTLNGVTRTINDNGSVTLNGTATGDISSSLGVLLVDKGSYVLSGCPSGGSLTSQFLAIPSLSAYDVGSGKEFIVTNKSSHSVFLAISKGQTLNNVTFYPMIRPVGTEATYEPYKEEVKYIPLNEPLRSSLDGSVSDVARPNEGKNTRKFIKVIFNGSENWLYNSEYNYIWLNNNEIDANIKKTGKVICSHFKQEVTLINADYCITIGTSTNLKNKDITSLSGWKTWLQANPITVIYELAEPIIEKIEPVGIVTYDNVTYLTASDNADMEIEYPTTKVAGIASIGYSKGIKAEYETEQLKKQLLEIQATIVNTL